MWLCHRHKTCAVCIWLLLLAFPSIASADCRSLFDFIEGADIAQADVVDALTFQKNNRGDLILLTFRKSGTTDVLGWKLLERRQKDTISFCQIGAGDDFGRLKDMHSNSSNERYGMPGSGHPRCSAHNSTLPGSIGVRWWANRELGESLILYGESKITSSFQFLVSSENAWIVIENKKNVEKSSCYFDRGDASLLKADISRKKP